MCLNCLDADKKAVAKEGEFCVGKVSFGELVRDLIQEWKETGRTTYNILKDAVEDRPSEFFSFSATDETKGAQELRIAFV
ncbi:MAG: hypothetical protein ACOYK9_03765 [Chlamydiia bacterium]